MKAAGKSELSAKLSVLVDKFVDKKSPTGGRGSDASGLLFLVFFWPIRYQRNSQFIYFLPATF
jgi:hypothetical protein